MHAILFTLQIVNNGDFNLHTPRLVEAVFDEFADGSVDFESLDLSLPDITVGIERGGSDRFRDEWESFENMRELVLGQAVKMRNEAVEFGAQFGALYRVGRTVFMALEPDLFCQVVKLRSRANQPASPFYNGPKG